MPPISVRQLLGLLMQDVHPDISNVALLEAHFKTFGGIEKIEPEPLNTEADTAVQEADAPIAVPPTKSFVVAYEARRGAEAALRDGRFLNGHRLDLSWATPTASALAAAPKSALATPAEASHPAVNDIDESSAQLSVE